MLFSREVSGVVGVTVCVTADVEVCGVRVVATVCGVRVVATVCGVSVVATFPFTLFISFLLGFVTGGLWAGVELCAKRGSKYDILER